MTSVNPRNGGNSPESAEFNMAMYTILCVPYLSSARLDYAAVLKDNFLISNSVYMSNDIYKAIKGMNKFKKFRVCL